MKDIMKLKICLSVIVAVTFTTVNMVNEQKEVIPYVLSAVVFPIATFLVLTLLTKKMKK